jgi:dTDP-4-dehydrorhamnose reductase
MRKILITGSNGLLGQKLIDRILAADGYELIATSKGENRHPIQKGYNYVELDITNKEEINMVIKRYQPHIIINTAALTNVDTCEIQQDLCWQMNVTAVSYLIDACAKTDIRLIHLSTDFIFDGANGPYTETDEPNPLSYYGKSKWAAEKLLIQSGIKWAILRTIIVYGIVKEMSRSNIILWAKKSLEKGETINVINDQWRMPTLAEDLADICLLATDKNAQGIFNASGKDMMSILEIVLAVADFYELDKSLIRPISSASLNQSAKRPAKTGFVLAKSIKELGYAPHSFDEGLKIMDKQLKELQRI